MLPPALSIGGYLEKRFIDVFTLYYELGYIKIKKVRWIHLCYP